MLLLFTVSAAAAGARRETITAGVERRKAETCGGRGDGSERSARERASERES